MKKIIVLLISSLLLFGFSSCGTSDKNRASEESPEWAGIYTGVIPAADSPGIMLRINLKKDLTYEVSYQYIDRGDDVFTCSGSFKWDIEGKTIVLDTDKIPQYYSIGNNTLTQLDMQGKKIDGEHAGSYTLNIQP